MSPEAPTRLAREMTAVLAETSAKVLVVDDEPEIRRLLSEVLSATGARIHLAASGAEAVALAESEPPDMLIADVCLGDCTGLEVIDRIRSRQPDVAAVVITGYGDVRTLTSASRRRPIEVMTKPLDVVRLRKTVGEELARQVKRRRTERRTKRLRLLARQKNLERKSIHRRLDATCADLAMGYRTISRQVTMQQVLLGYQQRLLGATDDDDVFRSLFQLIVRHSGPTFGAALVCDANAELHLVGRFGVPCPDSAEFCRALAGPVVGQTLSQGRSVMMDAGAEPELFDESIRRFLPGLTVLTVPLVPAPGELIGVVVFYRKGEQPFTDADAALAELVPCPTAMTVRRND